MSTRHMQFIDALRFPLICGVVLVHASVLEVEPQDWVAARDATSVAAVIQHLFSNIIARSAVPVLSVFSGYLFFRDGFPDGAGLRRKWLRRLASLGVPYLVWNTVGVALLVVGQSIPQLASYFTSQTLAIDQLTGWSILDCYVGYASGPANYPLWFLRDLLLITLAAPLIGWAVQRAPVLTLGAMFLAWNGLFVGLDVVPFVSERQILFFSVGALLALRRVDISRVFGMPLRNRLAVSCVFFAGAFAHTFVGAGNGWSLALYSLTMVAGVGMTLDLGGMWATSSPLARLSARSVRAALFIYVTHGFLIEALRKLAWRLARPEGSAGVLAFYFAAPTLVVVILLVVHRVLDASPARGFLRWSLGMTGRVRRSSERRDGARVPASQGDAIGVMSSQPGHGFSP